MADNIQDMTNEEKKELYLEIIDFIDTGTRAINELDDNISNEDLYYYESWATTDMKDELYKEIGRLEALINSENTEPEEEPEEDNETEEDTETDEETEENTEPEDETNETGESEEDTETNTETDEEEEEEEEEQ